MTKNPRLGKHSHNNRESREGEILRYVREAKKLSLQDVAEKMNMKALDVDHFENGRNFYKAEDIKRFLTCYDLTQEDFEKIMNFKILNKQIVNHFIIKNS